MVKRIIIGLLLVAGIGGITFAGLRPKAPKPVEVELAKVGRESITRTVSAAGKVASATTVKLQSNLSGDLIALSVKAGDKVTVGEVLARIDPTNYQAAVKSSTAALAASQADVALEKVNLAHAQAELDRVIKLNAGGDASAAEVEQARATLDGEKAKLASAQQRVAQSQGQLDQSRANLGYSVLKSPINGEVIELDRQLGERVRGSDFSEDVIMILATLSQMQVQMEVGEHEVVYLHQGDKADIELDAIENRSFPGEVIEIGQNAIIRNAGTEAEVTTFPIKVALDARPPGALPGMSATVHVATETHEGALVLPIQCVTVRPRTALAKQAPPTENKLPVAGAHSVPSETAKVVFVVKDGKAELREVHTGLSSENSVEILDGLEEGDTVVEGPYRTLAKELHAGDAVKDASATAKKGPGGPEKKS